jgi:hypothetical protein
MGIGLTLGNGTPSQFLRMDYEPTAIFMNKGHGGGMIGGIPKPKAGEMAVWPDTLGGPYHFHVLNPP